MRKLTTFAVVFSLSLLCFAVFYSASAQTQQLPDVQPPSGDDGGLVDADPGEVVSDPNFSIGLAVGAAGAGLAAWLAFRGGAKFVTRDNVLENETRSELYEFLEENPGTHLRGIAEELDLSTTNVLWHLRKLEDADLVRSEKQGGYKVFYLIEGGQQGKREAMAHSVLRNDNAQSILEYVSSEPGSHQRAIARALEVNHGTVRWHLKKMLDTDLVLQVRREHAIQYYLTDLGAKMLGETAPVQPTSAPAEGDQAAA